MTKEIYEKIVLEREEWSRIIQRLAAVDMWPRGQEGINLALELVGVNEELDRRNNVSADHS